MKVLKLLAVVAFGALLLGGCRAKGSEGVSGIKFDRGHGSAWGNQFYIELRKDEIVLARHIPRGQWDLVSAEHIPIPEEKWQQVKALAEQLPLEKARTTIWDRQKLDGGEYRLLTLQRGGEETLYRWPDTPQAQELEQLLEELVAQFCPEHGEIFDQEGS